MNKFLFKVSNVLLFTLVGGKGIGWTSPLQTTPSIKIDQFGYFPSSTKVAIIADPQQGLNGGESFSPGTGTGQYQVRRWSDDDVVFTGSLQAWSNGAIHSQSGDRGWWFNFSSVTASGWYYIFDLANNVGSYRLEISDQVYDEALKQSIPTFFYQQINFAKQLPYADSRWTDGACFEGSNQDHYATSRYANGDLSTSKDVHGGWMDAGFSRSAAVLTVSTTQLRFWVYNNDRNGLKIYLQNQNGVKSADVFYKPARAKWVEVILSMSQLGNPASIQKITIQNNAISSTSMVFDDIRFTNVSTGSALTASSARAFVAQEPKSALRIYPNPAQHQLTLQYTSKENTVLMLELLDPIGRKIVQRPFALAVGVNTCKLSLPQVASGMYYV